MTSILSIKVTALQKKFIINQIEKIIKETKGIFTEEDALVYICEQYKKHQIYIIKINATLQAIDCDYIEYFDKHFWCLEETDKTKKIYNLGDNPETVLKNCNACKQRKAELIAQKEELSELQQLVIMSNILVRFFKGMEK